jgi:ABC-type glutathione transport system ATPase component
MGGGGRWTSESENLVVHKEPTRLYEVMHRNNIFPILLAVQSDESISRLLCSLLSIASRTCDRIPRMGDRSWEMWYVPV